MHKIYFKNNFVSIYYDKAQRLGMAVWQGDLVGSEFREAVLLCLDLIDRHGLVAWLGDNRRMKSIRPDDVEWSQRVFVPQLMDSSLERLANLPSEDDENREAVEVIYKKVNNSEELAVRDFTSEEEALVWLREVL